MLLLKKKTVGVTPFKPTLDNGLKSSVLIYAHQYSYFIGFK